MYYYIYLKNKILRNYYKFYMLIVINIRSSEYINYNFKPKKWANNFYVKDQLQNSWLKERLGGKKSKMTRTMFIKYIPDDLGIF